MDIGISCIKVTENRFSYSVMSYFARYLPPPPILIDHPIGFIGIGDGDDITEALKSSVENAMTEFIKANFDL